jgi:hypothetical protein
MRRRHGPRVYGQLRRLAQDVPQRDVDAADGGRVDRSPSHVAVRAKQQLPDVLDGRRIRADQQRLVCRDDRPGQVSGNGVDLAEAVDARVGANADNQPPDVVRLHVRDPDRTVREGLGTLGSLGEQQVRAPRDHGCGRRGNRQFQQVTSTHAHDWDPLAVMYRIHSRLRMPRLGQLF